MPRGLLPSSSENQVCECGDKPGACETCRLSNIVIGLMDETGCLFCRQAGKVSIFQLLHFLRDLIRRQGVGDSVAKLVGGVQYLPQLPRYPRLWRAFCTAPSWSRTFASAPTWVSCRWL